MERSLFMKHDQSSASATSTPPASGHTGSRSQPLLGQRGKEIQAFGTLIRVPLGLEDQVRQNSVKLLNQILADTIVLRELYKKHHWQVAGPTFYQLHLLFDKHYQEQNELVDTLAERIQALGGVTVAAPHDVVEMTQIPRPPKGREEVPVQLSRLLEAHELILKESRQAARDVANAGDDGSNDLLVSDVVRTNELQVWFVSQHLVDMPLVKAD
jgi:starvation-inducible DNA-binding protein